MQGDNTPYYIDVYHKRGEQCMSDRRGRRSLLLGGQLLWIWWQRRLHVVPQHLHGHVISIVYGGQGRVSHFAWHG